MARQRESIVLMTSSAPFSMSEIWFQAEVLAASETFDVQLLPVWPRGDRKIWQGSGTLNNGKPNASMLTAALRVLRDSYLRTMLWSCRDSFNIRTAFKMIVSIFVGVQWGIDLRMRGLQIRHVHASTVGAPSAGAAALAYMMDCKVSATAHRNDINRRAPKEILRRLVLIRAISERARMKLDESDIVAERLIFGPLSHIIDPRPAGSLRTLRCVNIGYLCRVKGQNRAISAVSKAIQEGIPITLDIYGEGVLWEPLTKQIEELGLEGIVRLKGSVSHQDLLASMGNDNYDVLIHTSISDGEVEEGIPVAILEAAANRIAIIASDCGATNEFLTNDRNAILVDSVDQRIAIEQTASGLATLYEDVALRQDLIRNAAEDAVEYLAANSMHRIVERICELEAAF